MNTLLIYRRWPLGRRSQQWRWRLVHSNGNVIATSGEGYASREHCEQMARKVLVMDDVYMRWTGV